LPIFDEGFLVALRFINWESKVTRFLFLVFLILFIVSIPVAQTTYYVDPRGSDSNNGTSPGSAWSTLAKVNRTFFNPGDQVLFRRGEKWLEELRPASSGSGGNPIVFGAYGDGVRPVFSAVDEVPGWRSEANWTSVGGERWQYAGSISRDPIRMLFDGVEYGTAQTVASENSVGSTWRWYWESGTLTVYAPSNPASYYSKIELCAGNDRIALRGTDRSWLVFRSLALEGGAPCVEVSNVDNTVWDSCSISRWSGGGMSMKGGSDNCTIQYCRLDRGDEIVFAWQTKYVGGGDNLLMEGANGNEFKYSQFLNNRHDAININAAPGSTVNNNNIHHCEFRTSTDYGRALDIHGVTQGVESNNEFHHNYMHHLTMGIEFGGDHNKFYYNIVDTITYPPYWTSAVGRNIEAYGIYLLANGDPRICQYNQFYNNYFANTQGVGVRFSNNAGCIGNELYNNIFYNCGLDATGNPDLYRVAVWIPDAGTGWQRLENNLIYHPTQTNTILYRVYYDRAKHDVAWFNGQNGSNGDMLQNNIAVDPLVLPDYRIQSGSPARDAGTNVGSGADYWGDPVPYNGRVDIGVQEWRPTGASTLLPPVLLSPTDGSGGLPSTVRTRWARSAQASSYQVQVSVTPAFSSTVFERTSVSDTTLDVGPLPAGTKYFWRVRLTNGSTQSEYSPVWSFTALPETVATKPDDISAQGTPAALITNPRGSGSKSLGVIRDAVMPATNSTDPGLQYDTWDGAVRTFDWVGYTFSGDRTFTHLVFQEGLRYAPAGGWFRTLRVQVRSAGAWIDAVNLVSDPPYSTNSGQNFGSYDLKFDPAVGDGIRIAGQPAGNDTYISVAELRAYGGAATAPAVPIIVAPLAGATDQPTNPTVRWRRAIGATLYRLQIALDQAFAQIVLDDATPTDTLRTVGPLTVNTTYYVRVNSRNGVGASGFSAGVGFTTGTGTVTAPTTAPAILAPLAGATNQPTTFTARWTKTPGATSFHLQLALDATFSRIEINDSTLTDSLRSIGPLAVTTSYFLRVRSRNQQGAGPFSGPIAFSTVNAPITTPEAPALAQPPNNAALPSAVVTLTWNPVSAVSTYEVHVARDSLFTSIVVDSVIGRSQVALTAVATGEQYYWRVRSRTPQGSSEFSPVWKFNLQPASAYLSQNYPNPFNPSTVITYNLEVPGYVELKVYSVLGQEVATIVSGVQTPGLHRAEFDIKNVRGGQDALASGVYFYRLKTEQYSETRKMILRK
jgi:hypothetical protein